MTSEKIREASIHDIEPMHKLRMAVKENILNTPSLVTHEMYIKYLTAHGKGWLWEEDDKILGFGIVDHSSSNVWGLFIDNDHQVKGIGKSLQATMLNWYFSAYTEPLWLSTSQNTRASKFYALTGWENQGILNNGEIKFTMTADQWNKINE